tara:strand:- start:748 stop:1182 length:435 start_codon:yes stop_codon:yes gene_type:complete
MRVYVCIITLLSSLAGADFFTKAFNTTEKVVTTGKGVQQTVDKTEKIAMGQGTQQAADQLLVIGGNAYKPDPSGAKTEAYVNSDQGKQDLNEGIKYLQCGSSFIPLVGSEEDNIASMEADKPVSLCGKLGYSVETASLVTDSAD